MKKLVLGSLFAALAVSTGCTSSSGDDIGGDDGGGGGDAHIAATWSLHNLNTAQADLPCPPGTETAAVYTAPVDTDYNTIDAETTVDLFNCDAGAGTTAGLIPDKYQTWIELTDDVTGSGSSINHGNVYTKSPVWPDGLIEADREDIVDVLDGTGSAAFALIADGGYFAVGWSLQGNATCASANAEGVSVLSTEVANAQNSADDSFNCEAGFGITGGLAAANYTIAITATNAAEQGIGAPVTKTGAIVGPNRVTDLGNVVLATN